MVDAPEGKTISQLLESGDIDAFIAPRVPRLAGKKNPNIGWLFPDPIAAGKDYFKRTGIFPIMHVTGIRRTLVEQHPWLPAAVFKALEQSKAKCMEELEDTATSKCTLPFLDEQLRAARELMGHDFWSYGLARQPQGAGDVPALPPHGRAVVAARDAGGDVPSLDARELHDLIAASLQVNPPPVGRVACARSVAGGLACSQRLQPARTVGPATAPTWVGARRSAP